LRNDLAKTCRDHSIEVPDLCALESFSNVHHLVSTVRGELAPNKTPLDALRASFPGGSITGAPKIRAMEIIDEMEPHRRGPSYGSLGYIGFDATMDVNIIIRTAMICGDELQFHVGGGIVADSQPALEYQETLNKAGGLLAALGVDMRSLPNTTEQGPIEQEQAS
jgi:para-aminobenzoate synthetase component 1